MDEQGKRGPFNKKALWGFMLSVLSFFFWPAGIPALVLFFIAIREFRKDPSQRGFQLASWGVVLVLVPYLIIVLLVGWTLNPYEGFRLKNEVRALDALQDARTAFGNFARQEGGFPSTLRELVDRGFTKEELPERSFMGYYFRYYPTRLVEDRSGKPRRYSTFVLDIRPRSTLVGETSFLFDQTGTITLRKSPEMESQVLHTLPPPADWPSVIERVGKMP